MSLKRCMCVCGHVMSRQVYYKGTGMNWTVWMELKQDRQALLKAKYCSRACPCKISTNFLLQGTQPPLAPPSEWICVARLFIACCITHTQKIPIWPWPMTLIFNMLLEVVKVQNFIKLSAAVHTSYCVDRAAMPKTILPSLLHRQ